jgi:phosphoglycerate dehydrogenase-like enzyme
LLVNTARGALVDEAALAEALTNGSIAGAGIDVFAQEPLDPAHPLRRCPNVLLTPHTAGQTREAMDRMVALMLDNLGRVERGETPRCLVG